MTLDPQLLKQIIREELLLALRELDAEYGADPRDGAALPAVAQLPRPEKTLGRALLICTGAQPLKPALLERLQALRAQGVELCLLAGGEFEAGGGVNPLFETCGALRCSADAILAPFESFCRQFQFVLLPGLAIDTAVKTVWGLTDTPASKTLFECLRRRFPVLFMHDPRRDAFELPWNGAVDRSWPLWVRDNLHQIWRTLLEWGVRETDLAEVGERALELIRHPPVEMAWRVSGQYQQPRGVRIYVTAGDVDALWRAGERALRLPPNALLTPEAAELAAKLELKIVNTFPDS